MIAVTKFFNDPPEVVTYPDLCDHLENKLAIGSAGMDEATIIQCAFAICTSLREYGYLPDREVAAGA